MKDKKKKEKDFISPSKDTLDKFIGKGEANKKKLFKRAK